MPTASCRANRCRRWPGSTTARDHAMHSETTLCIDAGHPALPGHFPGTPIVPGVLLLDAALHALTQLVGPVAGTCQVTSAKFLSPVAPGERLTLRVETQAAGMARFEISSEARKVASG